MKRVSLLIIKSLILIDVLGCESHSCQADLVPVSASPKYYRYDEFPSKVSVLQLISVLDITIHLCISRPLKTCVERCRTYVQN